MRGTAQNAAKPAPLFVKGSVPDDQKEVTTTAARIEAPPEQKEPSAEELECQKQQQAANERFMDLLNRGRGGRKRRHAENDHANEYTYYAKRHNQHQPMLIVWRLAWAFVRARRVSEQHLHNNSRKKKCRTRQLLRDLVASLPPLDDDHKRLPLERKRTPTWPLGRSTPGALVPSCWPKWATAAVADWGPKNKRTTKSKGISRPIQVKVRPANLGLGFGNFKEATQLKSNRQLEAENSW